MRVIDARVSAVINSVDREFRVPVMEAARLSDGTLLSFQQELSAQVWDYPELNVEDILTRVSYDVV